MDPSVPMGRGERLLCLLSWVGWTRNQFRSCEGNKPSVDRGRHVFGDLRHWHPVYNIAQMTGFCDFQRYFPRTRVACKTTYTPDTIYLPCPSMPPKPIWLAIAESLDMSKPPGPPPPPRLLIMACMSMFPRPMEDILC